MDGRKLKWFGGCNIIPASFCVAGYKNQNEWVGAWCYVYGVACLSSLTLLAVVVGLAKIILFCFTIMINLIFLFSQWCINWVREPLCEPNILYMFVLNITSGHRLKFVDSESALNPRQCMLLTGLRRWFRSCSYSVQLRVASCLVLPCSLFLCW